jgi:cobalamin biosynthesis Mg chelatase CobN
LRIYGQISKVEPLDDGSVRVEGIASTEIGEFRRPRNDVFQLVSG